MCHVLKFFLLVNPERKSKYSWQDPGTANHWPRWTPQWMLSWSWRHHPSSSPWGWSPWSPAHCHQQCPWYYLRPLRAHRMPSTCSLPKPKPWHRPKAWVQQSALALLLKLQDQKTPQMSPLRRQPMMPQRPVPPPGLEACCQCWRDKVHRPKTENLLEKKAQRGQACSRIVVAKRNLKRT